MKNETPTRTAPPSPRFVRPRNVLQDQIVDLWEELLDQRHISIDDNFFSLGGTSDLAEQLFNGIEHLCGDRLQWSDVPDAPTVRNLADTLVARLPYASVLEIQSGDQSAAPLFYLHGDLGGGGFYVRELARGLDPSQPVYALQHHGIHGEDIPSTAQAMAVDHLRCVRELRADGPLYLGGHCCGGVIAFEMGLQLAREGRTLPTLLIVEPPARRNDTTPSPPVPPLSAAKRRLPRFNGPWLFARYYELLRPYRFDVYEGKVGVFIARDGVLNAAEVRAQWETIAAHVDVYAIPGTHISAPGRHVRKMAATINAWLSGQDATGS